MKQVHVLAAVAAFAALGGCGTDTAMRSGPPAGPSAMATLEPTKGNTTAGTVTFTQQGDRVMVVAKVSGLKPNQEHGMHAHEKGDCSSGDGMSTGGHFN